MKCTWVGCNRNDATRQLAKDGQTWACLCPEHDSEINDDIRRGDARKILSDWVKAQGGAKKAAKRI